MRKVLIIFLSLLSIVNYVSVVFATNWNDILIEDEESIAVEDTSEESQKDTTLIKEAYENRLRLRDAVQEVDSGIDPETFLHYSYGISDIFSISCLIFVVVVVVIGWIRHTLQQREDPFRQWRK